MNEDKLNKSFLTTEAKEDINEMLGRNEGSGLSSFTTQLETSEGLTIGKGTDNEESLTANELKGIKSNIPKYNVIWSNPFPVGTYPSKTLTVIPLNINANQLLAIKKFISDNLINNDYSTCFLSLTDYKATGIQSYAWDIEVVPLFKMGNNHNNIIYRNNVSTITDLALGFYNKTDSELNPSSFGGGEIIVNFTKWFEH